MTGFGVSGTLSKIPFEIEKNLQIFPGFSPNIPGDTVEVQENPTKSKILHFLAGSRMTLPNVKCQ